MEVGHRERPNFAFVTKYRSGLVLTCLMNRDIHAFAKVKAGPCPFCREMMPGNFQSPRLAWEFKISNTMPATTPTAGEHVGIAEKTAEELTQIRMQLQWQRQVQEAGREIREHEEPVQEVERDEQLFWGNKRLKQVRKHMEFEPVEQLTDMNSRMPEPLRVAR